MGMTEEIREDNIIAPALSEQAERAAASAAGYVRKMLDPQTYRIGERPDAEDESGEFGDPKENTALVKRIATMFGANQAGVCIPDEDWFRSEDSIAEMGFTSDTIRAVVIAVPMDASAFSELPTKAVSRATTMGYMQMSLVAGAVAAFIRDLGFHAVAQGNGVAVSAPMAEKAGLGEIGYHGMLVTQDLGASVRLCKVFTDMELEPDLPVNLGVREKCASCNQCIEVCPTQAFIPVDDPKEIYSGLTVDSYWRVDGDKCREQWNQLGTSCGICIAVCPFTPSA